MTRLEHLTYVHAMIVELRDMTVGEDLLTYLLEMAALEAATIMATESRSNPPKKRVNEPN